MTARMATKQIFATRLGENVTVKYKDSNCKIHVITDSTDRTTVHRTCSVQAYVSKLPYATGQCTDPISRCRCSIQASFAHHA